MDNTCVCRMRPCTIRGSHTYVYVLLHHVLVISLVAGTSSKQTVCLLDSVSQKRHVLVNVSLLISKQELV